MPFVFKAMLHNIVCTYLLLNLISVESIFLYGRHLPYQEQPYLDTNQDVEEEYHYRTQRKQPDVKYFIDLLNKGKKSMGLQTDDPQDLSWLINEVENPKSLGNVFRSRNMSRILEQSSNLESEPDEEKLIELSGEGKKLHVDTATSISLEEKEKIRSANEEEKNRVEGDFQIVVDKFDPSSNSSNDVKRIEINEADVVEPATTTAETPSLANSRLRRDEESEREEDSESRQNVSGTRRAIRSLVTRENETAGKRSSANASLWIIPLLVLLSALSFFAAYSSRATLSSRVQAFLKQRNPSSKEQEFKVLEILTDFEQDGAGLEWQNENGEWH